MKKALDGPRITPFHRWITHARKRHIKVEERPQDPASAHSKHHKPFQPQFAGAPTEFDNANKSGQDEEPEKAAFGQCGSTKQTESGYRAIQAKLQECFSRQVTEPEISEDGTNPHNIENHEYGRILIQRCEHVLRLQYQPGQINYAVPQKKIPAQAVIGGRDRHLNSHGCDNQRLMIREANSMEEHCKIKISPLMRGVDPSQ